MGKHTKNPECCSADYALLAAYCKQRGRWAEVRFMDGTIRVAIYKPTDAGKIEIAHYMSFDENLSIAEALYKAMVYDATDE